MTRPGQQPAPNSQLSSTSSRRNPNASCRSAANKVVAIHLAMHWPWVKRNIFKVRPTSPAQ